MAVIGPLMWTTLAQGQSLRFVLVFSVSNLGIILNNRNKLIVVSVTFLLLGQLYEGC